MINPKSRVRWSRHKSCFIGPQVGSNPPRFFGQPVWWGLLMIALWRKAQKLSVLARHWHLNDQCLKGKTVFSALIKNMVISSITSSFSHKSKLPATISKKLKFCHHLLTLNWFQPSTNVFVLANTKEDILKNVGNRAVLGHNWLPYIFFLLWKSMVPQNCVATNFLQNIFLCVRQNKDIRTGLEPIEGE